MKLSELLTIFENFPVSPQKKWSQNFLIDQNIAKKIVETAQVSPEEVVLEIGPGAGILTNLLLEKGAFVYAVEIDPFFAQNLHRLQNGRLSIFQADFLKFSLDLLPPGSFKVVANLPYHITTPILEKLFSHNFSTLTLMMQKEMAQRIVAKPQEEHFSSLSLYAQFQAEILTHFPVSSSCFYPKPSVASSVVHFKAKPPSSPAPFSLIRLAFQKRRKALTSSLPYPKEILRQTLLDLGLKPDARPETLSLAHWISLYKILSETNTIATL